MFVYICLYIYRYHLPKFFVLNYLHKYQTTEQDFFILFTDIYVLQYLQKWIMLHMYLVAEITNRPDFLFKKYCWKPHSSTLYNLVILKLSFTLLWTDHLLSIHIVTSYKSTRLMWWGAIPGFQVSLSPQNGTLKAVT